MEYSYIKRNGISRGTTQYELHGMEKYENRMLMVVLNKEYQVGLAYINHLTNIASNFSGKLKQLKNELYICNLF